MLDVRDLNAWYCESHVLQGMSFFVEEGEVVTLLGRNGAGKTTTLKAIMGLMSRTEGSISWKGAEILGMRPDRIGRLGLALCPEHRGIFASLTVRENLMLPPKIGPHGVPMDEIERLFPNLFERAGSPGTYLSGGEQQMLAIARILRAGGKFLIFDELTEGLAPVIVAQIGAMLRRIRELGYTILLVEQNVGFACAIADRHYLVEHGQVIDCIKGADFERQIGRVNSTLGL